MPRRTVKHPVPGSAPARRGLPAAVALALLLLLQLPGAASGCAASTPQRAVGDFIRARIDGNEEKAAKLTVEEDLAGYLGGEPYFHTAGASYEIGLPEVEGDRALVVVRFRWDDQSAEIPYVTRRQGARWKVALRETEELWLPEAGFEGEPPGG